MLRAALLRSAAVATARPAIRSVSRSLSSAAAAVVSRPTTLRAATKSFAPRVASWKAVRCYSAGSGLNKEEVEGRIMNMLTSFDKVTDPVKITPTAHFANDLGLDSLDQVEVVMAIEEEFSIEIPDKDADTIHSIDKAVEYIMSQPDAH